MARTFEEHADRVYRKLRRAESAQKALHEALADFVREHGAAAGIGADIVALAVVPKDPPPNPE